MSKLIKSTPFVRNIIFRGIHCRCPTKHPYQQSPTYVVTFLRHGESKWNVSNLFTGWYDSPLTDKGVSEAQNASKVFKKEAMHFDIIFTSRLKRARDTAFYVINCDKKSKVRIVEDYRLNERHCGILTGFSRNVLAKHYGEEKVRLWRRGFEIIPPPMPDDHPYFKDIEAKFPDITVPRSESLKMTLKRSIDFWRSSIVPEIKAGRKVLIVAHNNTLRAIIKYLDDLSDTEILSVSFDNGIPFTYTLDMYMKPVRNKRMQYLIQKDEPKQCKIR